MSRKLQPTTSVEPNDCADRFQATEPDTPAVEGESVGEERQQHDRRANRESVASPQFRERQRAKRPRADALRPTLVACIPPELLGTEHELAPTGFGQFGQRRLVCHELRHICRRVHSAVATRAICASRLRRPKPTMSHSLHRPTRKGCTTSPLV
jgi:hypothetical protein